jgi:leader peptidase (prepilin peptidase)/N-methyltransferase
MTTPLLLIAFAAVLVGVLGLAIGSFLNVVVYRVPLGASVVSPPSACPNCKSEIKAYDNIPVLSWLLLRGRCRNCANGISVRYPIVEASTALFFAGVAAFFIRTISSAPTASLAIANAIALAAFLYLVAISVALAIIDLETHKLPNAIVLPSYLVAGVLFVAASIVGGQYDALLRAGIGMVALVVIYFVLAFFSRGGMGMGDVKLAGVLGLYLGWSGYGALFIGSLAAFLLGGVFGVALILIRKAGRKSGIPFGPWMLAGAWIGIFAGNQIWGGYLSLLGVAA